MTTHGWLFQAERVGRLSEPGVPSTDDALGPAAMSQSDLEEDDDVSRRPIRVVLLTIAIVVMSLADLQITLTYLRSGGMGEGNPIARYVMEHGSTGLLVAWKCASVALTALIFVRFRSRRSTEIASWGCAIVLVWLLIKWSAYSDEAWRLTPALHLLPHAEASMWVELPD